MARAPVDRERRALLGAAVGVPLVGVPSALAPPAVCAAAPPPPCGRSPSPAGAGEDWEAALAAYRAAEAEVRGFERATAGRPFVAEDRLDDVYGELGDIMYGALRGLLAAPAPDVGALAVKLDLAVEHEVGTLEGGEACLAAIRADAWRLAGAEVARG